MAKVANITCKTVYKTERFYRNVADRTVWSLRAGRSKKGKVLFSCNEYHKNSDYGLKEEDWAYKPHPRERLKDYAQKWGYEIVTSRETLEAIRSK